MYIGWNGRATFASSQTAIRSGYVLIHIRSTMHDNAAAVSVIVDSFFHTQQTKGIPFLAHISFASQIKTEAALKTTEAVREFGSEQFTGIPAVGNQGIEKQFSVLQIQNKQSFFKRGQAKVYDGQDACIL